MCCLVMSYYTLLNEHHIVCYRSKHEQKSEHGEVARVQLIQYMDGKMNAEWDRLLSMFCLCDI